MVTTHTFQKGRGHVRIPIIYRKPSRQAICMGCGVAPGEPSLLCLLPQASNAMDYWRHEKSPLSLSLSNYEALVTVLFLWELFGNYTCLIKQENENRECINSNGSIAPPSDEFCHILQVFLGPTLVLLFIRASNKLE